MKITKISVFITSINNGTIPPNTTLECKDGQVNYGGCDEYNCEYYYDNRLTPADAYNLADALLSPNCPSNLTLEIDFTSNTLTPGMRFLAYVIASETCSQKFKVSLGAISSGCGEGRTWCSNSFKMYYLIEKLKQDAHATEDRLKQMVEARNNQSTSCMSSIYLSGIRFRFGIDAIHNEHNANSALKIK